ncbi:MAG TPA: transglycosylase family protein [Solirubrobacteraceae bacterium]|nr:transglycosylase family protein [Solirubrobacteraceae bacterium]
MSKSRSWVLAALAAGLAAPAGIALAAGPPSPGVSVGLDSVLAGHRSVGAQMRAEAARQRRARARRAAALPPILQRIAECESHGDPTLIGGGGMYRGKYQFTRSAWAGVGGHGDPAEAPEAEQDRRAAILLKRSGPSQWPVCSR